MNDLSRLDWNLLPALDALLTELNVSRAARRAGTTQPAMSNALRRLRRHFGDDLLVRTGNTYRPTPLAERLAPLVADLVELSVDVGTLAASFDPASSERRFTIAATEAMQLTVGARLVDALSSAAPRATVGFVAPFVEPFRTNDDILAGADGWIAPSEMLPGRRCVGEYWDRWICVVDRDHPTVGDELTLDAASSLSWVVPTIRSAPISHLATFAAHGIDPRVVLFTEGFTSVPFLVAGSARVGIVQRQVALRLADAAGVRLLECPWPTTPLRLTFWWDQRWASDPAHTWLRGVVKACMTCLGETGA